MKEHKNITVSILLVIIGFGFVLMYFLHLFDATLCGIGIVLIVFNLIRLLLALKRMNN